LWLRFLFVFYFVVILICSKFSCGFCSIPVVQYDVCFAEFYLNRLQFLCNFAGDNGDCRGDECCLWSCVIYGDMCHSSGTVLGSFYSHHHHGRHYVGYDSAIGCALLLRPAASPLITRVIFLRFWTFSRFGNWSSQWLSRGNLDFLK